MDNKDYTVKFKLLLHRLFYVWVVDFTDTEKVAFQFSTILHEH